MRLKTRKTHKKAEYHGPFFIIYDYVRLSATLRESTPVFDKIKLPQGARKRFLSQARRRLKLAARDGFRLIDETLPPKLQETF